ncbi:MAG: serine hydrolase [Anaerolineaceae bacterium]|nr:serine hydrolase [Anaerolineaceae bacterium]
MFYKRKKKAKLWRPIMGAVGGLCMLAACMIALLNYSHFARKKELYPAGLTLGGVPIGNLSRAEAESRLHSVYGSPIELRYQGARMQFLPQALGFDLNAEIVLDSLEASHQPDAKFFKWWQTLWGKQASSQPMQIDLYPGQNTDAIKKLVDNEIRPRYDQKAYAPLPILNTTYFEPGSAGWQLSLSEQTVSDITAALASPKERIVDLEIETLPVPRLDPKNLEVALKVIIQNEGFDGLVELYTQDMQNAEILHFAQNAFQPLAPDIAYSAASTIKIPIMVSVMRHLNGELPGLAEGWILQMLTKSLNPPADALMKTYLGEADGPLAVTRDMQDLGYQNTFLAGYFADGSPLLQRFSSPANQRTDINIKPDIYNQTVPSEIGDLLGRIYQCSIGAAPEKGLYNGQIGQAACQHMVEVMSQNRMGALIEAGLPPSQAIAHKHGWTSDADGLLHTVSDVGIILDGQNSYVEVIFVHTPRQLIFDAGSYLVARLSQCLYNAKHIENQTVWLGK